MLETEFKILRIQLKHVFSETWLLLCIPKLLTKRNEIFVSAQQTVYMSLEQLFLVLLTKAEHRS